MRNYSMCAEATLIAMEKESHWVNIVITPNGPTDVDFSMESVSCTETKALGTDDRSPALLLPNTEQTVSGDENHSPLPLPPPSLPNEGQGGCKVVETSNDDDCLRFASEIISELIDKLPTDAAKSDHKCNIEVSPISPVTDATFLFDNHDHFLDVESSFHSVSDRSQYIERFVRDTDSEFESAVDFAVNLSSDDDDAKGTPTPADVNHEHDEFLPNESSLLINNDFNFQTEKGGSEFIPAEVYSSHFLTDSVDRIDSSSADTPIIEVSDSIREEEVTLKEELPQSVNRLAKSLARIVADDDAVALADSLLDFEREEFKSQQRSFIRDETLSQSEIPVKSNEMPTAESSETGDCATTAADSAVVDLDVDAFKERSLLADSPVRPSEDRAICPESTTVVDVGSICDSEDNDNVKNGAKVIVPRMPSPISADTDDCRSAPQCLMESSISEDSGIDVPQASKDVHLNASQATDSRDVANFSEAGPDVANVSKCGDPVDDQFCPATDFFLDPNSLDFLEKCDSGKFTQSVLSRMSLYMKFDPLVSASGNVPSPVSRRLTMWLKQQQEAAVADTKPTVKSRIDDDPPNATATDDDTLKFDGPQKLIDLEASLNLENRSELDDSSSSPSPSPLKSKSKSYVTEEKRRSGGIVLSNSGDDEVRQMMKIQELLFQDRQLMKEREWDERLRSQEADKQKLADQVHSLRESQHQMRQIVTEYEKTISQLISDKESDKRTMSESAAQITRERDQALEDLQSVENAFADLHRRYEKAKVTVEGFKKNEDTLKGCVTTLQAKLNRQVDLYEQLRNCAEERLESANQEIENLKKTNEAELAALRAQLKKAEMKVESLEKSLEQKVKENSELTNICDELIARVGQNA